MVSLLLSSSHSLLSPLPSFRSQDCWRCIGWVHESMCATFCSPQSVLLCFFPSWFLFWFVSSLPLRLHRNPHPFKSYFFLIFPSACIKIGKISVSLQSFNFARWFQLPSGKGDFHLTDILMPRFQCSLLDFGCKDKNFFGYYCWFLLIA